MRRKWLPLALCALLLCPAFAGAEQGSCAQINQNLTRPEGWRRIATGSAFALGEPVATGTLPDGSALLSVPFGTYPRLDGSTVAVPLAMELARQHLTLSEADIPGFVFFSTTHGAYENLIARLPGGMTTIASRGAVMDEAHPVDLILATYPSREELDMAAQASVVLASEPVCYDAFVFITHADNPVESLTQEQIRDIYAGRITSWSQVGGPELDIVPYQREANSGSQTAMEELVMRGEPMAAAEENMVDQGMGRLVYRVGEYRNNEMSLGYTYQYYIDVLYRSDQIKTLQVDGVSPTPENMRNGSYPFATHYYAVIREEDAQGPAGLFQQWLLSDEGQQCVAQAGYVPLRGVQ